MLVLYLSNMKSLLFHLVFSFLLTLGPPLPKARRIFSMLEMHGDVYVIGGWDGSAYQSSIYQLSCSSGLCSWSTINQELKVARASSVAIPVPDYFCK